MKDTSSKMKTTRRAPAWLAVAALCLPAVAEAARQPGKDGPLTVAANTVVNLYGSLAANVTAGSTSLSVANPGGANALDPTTLTANDLLLVIQMQGASIDTTNTAAYGSVTAYSNAGFWEFVTVSGPGVGGGPYTVPLDGLGLKNSYTAAGNVQVIRVPQYSTLTVNAGFAITARNWGGAVGGVIAVDVQGTATLNGDLDAGGRGFRGGTLSTAGTIPFAGFRSTSISDGAHKGEGIAGFLTAYDSLGGRYGRGAAANGGGGGNAHDAGGGGGANASNGRPWNGQGNPDRGAANVWDPAWNLDPTLNALTTSSGGGRGGYTFSDVNRNALTEPPGSALWGGDSRRELGGLGGRPLSYGPALSRLFLGGGGGAGAQTNANAGAGGRGGGLVFLYAATVTGTGRILASGAVGGSTTGNHEDAPGGAGGGGTVVVQATNSVTLGQIRADGGAGGSQSTPVAFPAEAQGAGGGGGGGYIHVCAPTVTVGTRTANGGVNGTTASTSLTEFPPNGATQGAAGNAAAGAACIGAGPPALTFTDVSTASGLNVGGNKTGGVAWGDFNNDTCPDALVNTSDAVLTTRIYAQNKSGAACLGTFVDVTQCLAGGLLSNMYDRAVTWGDYDNDGNLDFARSHNTNVEVYRSGGPGVTVHASCPAGSFAWSRFGVVNGGDPNCTLGGCRNQSFVLNAEGLGWIDFDQDGDLDLFIQDAGSLVMATNNPTGTLTIDTTTGLPAAAANGDYSAVADYDVDGDVDVIARQDDGRPLWWNDGTAPTFFAQNANLTQAANNGNKGGVAFCDFDGDLDFDLFWTDFPANVNRIWRNNGGVNGAVTWTAMAALPTGTDNVDGASCGDFDHDGDLDLMLNVAAGATGDYLFRNDGAFTFVNVPPAGFGTAVSPAGALADYDRDGDLDLLVNQGGGNQLWRNEANDQNYLMVRAVHDVGVAQRDAIGATVSLRNCTGTPVSPVKEVSGGSGHGSQDMSLVHFGLRRAVAPTGPGSVYIVHVQFVGGGIVERAVVPSALGCYQMVTIKNTDPTDLAACTPTSVELQDFTAAPADGAVDLSWTTASELRNLGFHVHRSTAPDGPWTRITSSLIPGLGSSATGASYAWRDSGLSNGTTYHYLLEDVETTGRTERHGPVSATPQAGGAGGGSGDGSGGGDGSLDPGDGSEGSSDSGRITWGHPAGASLRILERGAAHVVLELFTPGFTAVTQSEGTVRISIPGFEDAALPGTLDVPVRHALLEALAGRRARLAGIEPKDLVSFDSFRLSAAGTRELVALEDGTLRTGSSPRHLLESHRRAGFTPRTWARLLGSSFQGETKKVRLELSPFRHDPVSGKTLLAQRLTVRVEFAGQEMGERSLGGSRGRRPPPPSLRRSGVLAQLVARTPGLYRIRFEDLFASGQRGLPARTLRLSRRGVPVPYHLEPATSLFAQGGSLFFVNDGKDPDPRGESVFELSRGQAVFMDEVSAAASGPSTLEILHTLEREENKTYQSALLQAPDLWLWDSLISPVTKTYPFTVEALSPSSTSGHLKVVLQGGSDFQEVDHHLRLSVNGIPVGETTWDGMTEQVVEADLTVGVLVEGTNTLALENVGDAGAVYSLVFLNRFEVTYPRLLTATNAQLEGRFEASGRAEVSGLVGTSFVVDTTTDETVWLEAPESLPTGLAFRAETGHRYLALSESALLVPEVRRPTGIRLRNSATRADWVLIAPREFLPAATPLLDLRRRQGLLPLAVATEDVFAEFGYGEARPSAIRDFLAFAFHHWKTRPRYAVLLGDTTYDPRNFLGTGVKDRVPSPLLQTTYLWTVSDPSLAAVNGDDLLPDLAIGRLSAGTLTEAHRLVAKLVAFEQASRTFDGTAILVADNADLAGSFEQNQDEIAQTVLQGRTVEKIYLRDLGSSTRTTIRSALDSGPGLLSYVGHGATAVWASENVWNNTDLLTLSPQDQQPLLLTLNCLNGFFHFPPFDSLAEAFVKAEGKGAIAAFSPSGLSVNEPAHLFHKTFLQELAQGPHARLGDALLAAQKTYADSGHMPELLSIYHLFGDPGMQIR